MYKPLDTKLLGELYEAVEALIRETNFNDIEQALAFKHTEPVKQLLKLCYIDTRAYAKVFYGDRFSLPFSELHDEAFSIIDAKDEKGEPLHKKIVFKAFRGFGKTTTVKTIAAKRIRFQDSRFVVYIGKNEGFSMMQTEAIKNGMLMNRLETFLFGPVKAKYHSGGIDASFSKKTWVTNYGTMVLPRGAGQPVRGLLFDWDLNSYRPDLFIIDDLEDIKLIENEEFRDELYLWLLGDVVEAKPLPGVSTNWQIIYIDTLKHEDAVLQRLMDREDWLSIDLSLCDESFKSRVPYFYSTEKIIQEVKEHREAGTLDVFYREKMGKPIATIDASFKKDYFRYYDEEDQIEDNGRNFTKFKKEKPYLETVVLADPAKTVKMHNAESGFAVVSFNPFEHRIFIRYAEGLRLYPDEFYNHAFELAFQYGARVIGYEITGLDEFIKKPMTDAMLEKGYSFELIPLRARRGQGEFAGVGGGKKGRVASMIPYYRKGQIYHNITGCGSLEIQLLSYPKSKRWDVMDVTAYFVELLEQGDRFWIPPGMGSESPDEIEKEYEMLEREDMMEGDLGDDWRII